MNKLNVKVAYKTSNKLERYLKLTNKNTTIKNYYGTGFYKVKCNGVNKLMWAK